MAWERQTSALPPAQPSYVLRGHTAQVHSVQFVRQNSRLITGDADGWIVYWKLETKRALAVWQAHDGAILGTDEWGRNNIITHGRDNSLRIWQLRTSDEPTLCTTLPAEDATTPRPKPWLLHTLPVNTLNFCAFSMCADECYTTAPQNVILVATPSTDDKKINVYQFPDEKLKYIVPKIPTADTGMVMAVKLVNHLPSQTVLVLSGYEGGLTAVHQLPPGNVSSMQSAQLVYLSQPHTQPVLSLDVSPDATTYFTSSADSVLAAHRIPELWLHTARADDTEVDIQGKNPSAISNAFISASAGVSDSNDTVLISTLHSEDKRTKSSEPTDTGAMSTISFSKQPIQPFSATNTSTAGLSSLLSSSVSLPKLSSPPPSPRSTTIQSPYRFINSKHSGQQSLRVRSDGRILATGGWDTRIRVYSARTLKEVAVLKWHKEGVYAVDVAKILEAGDLQRDEEVRDGEVAGKETGLGRLQRQREEAMQLKHYVVAGAKDGKVSLWEVF